MNIDRWKVRIWDIPNHQMIYSDSVNDFDTISAVLEWIWSGEPSEYYIPLLCTGLKDKEDKLIWEGDILDWYRDKDDINPLQAVVQWERWKFNAPIRSIPADGREAQGPNFWLDRLIVRGNIYENPDILRKYVGVNYGK